MWVIVQVAVVLVCALQRDSVHAGYLALSLMLFRERAALQQAAIKRWKQHNPRAYSIPEQNRTEQGVHPQQPNRDHQADVELGQHSAQPQSRVSVSGWLWRSFSTELHDGSDDSVGRRTSSRSSRDVGILGLLPGTPFWMLPVFNLLVLLGQAVYQVSPPDVVLTYIIICMQSYQPI